MVEGFAKWITRKVSEDRRSQNQIALAIGVSSTALGHWMRGVYPPGYDKLQGIADAFGEEVGLVRRVAGYEEPGEWDRPIPDATLSPSEEMVVRAMRLAEAEAEEADREWIQFVVLSARSRLRRGKRQGAGSDAAT